MYLIFISYKYSLNMTRNVIIALYRSSGDKIPCGNLHARLYVIITAVF